MKVKEKSIKEIARKLADEAQQLVLDGKTGITIFVTSPILDDLRTLKGVYALHTMPGDVAEIHAPLLYGFPVKCVLMFGGSYFVAHSRSCLDKMDGHIYIHPNHKALVRPKVKQEVTFVTGEVKVKVKRNSDLGDEFATYYYSCAGCDTPVDPSWKVCPKCVKQLIFPEEEDQNNG